MGGLATLQGRQETSLSKLTKNVVVALINALYCIQKSSELAEVSECAM